MIKTKQSKHATLEAATEAAKADSMDGTVMNVIESRGEFFADEMGFIRNWETCHATYKNGKLLK